MDNRLHNDCDGGQCWACAADKLDTMTKYAGAEVDRNASLRTRAEIAETAYERCREENAELLDALGLLVEFHDFPVEAKRPDAWELRINHARRIRAKHEGTD